MVYSAIETTCFGLYWPSSGFYNIEEGSIIAVKLATPARVFFSVYNFFSIFPNSSCTRNRIVRELI